MIKYDKIILGAGLYGLYAAQLCASRGQHVLVLECDDAPFKTCDLHQPGKSTPGISLSALALNCDEISGIFCSF